MVAIADEQHVEQMLLAVRGSDAPSAVVEPLRPLDSRVEANPLAQTEAIGVLVQELVYLGVVGEVGVALIHWEVVEADRILRGIDVERAVRRGASVGVAEVPVAADVIRCLEAGVRDVPIAQSLDRGQSAHPGSDYARAWAIPH